MIDSVITHSRSVLAACILVMVFFVPALMAEPWQPESKIQAYLESNYPWQKIEVTNVSIAGDLIEASPDMITVEKGPVGKGVFTFVYDNDQKVTVKADVRALDTVVKSIRPMKKGSVLEDGDIYLAEMDINRMPKSAVKEPESVIGKPLKRSILADMVIAEDMVERTTVVKKGNRVTLLFHAPGFSIRAAGEIREKGYVGTQVKAVNLSSKKEVRGVLIDENTVRVEL